MDKNESLFLLVEKKKKKKCEREVKIWGICLKYSICKYSNWLNKYLLVVFIHQSILLQIELTMSGFINNDQYLHFYSVFFNCFQTLVTYEVMKTVSLNFGSQVINATRQCLKYMSRHSWTYYARTAEKTLSWRISKSPI